MNTNRKIDNYEEDEETFDINVEDKKAISIIDIKNESSSKIVFTEEERSRINNASLMDVLPKKTVDSLMGSKKVDSAILMRLIASKCVGGVPVCLESCPITNLCSIYESRSEGFPCPIYVEVLKNYVSYYMEGYVINYKNKKHRAIIPDILDLAATRTMEDFMWASINSEGSVISDVIGVDNEGNQVTKESRHPLYDVVQQLFKRKESLVNHIELLLGYRSKNVSSDVNEFVKKMLNGVSDKQINKDLGLSQLEDEESEETDG